MALGSQIINWQRTNNIDTCITNQKRTQELIKVFS